MYLAGAEVLLFRRDERVIVRVQVLAARIWGVARGAGAGGSQRPSISRRDGACAAARANKGRRAQRATAPRQGASKAGRAARRQPHQAMSRVVGVNKQRLEVGHRAHVRGLNRHLRTYRVARTCIRARVRDALAVPDLHTRREGGWVPALGALGTRKRTGSVNSGSSSS